METAVDSILAVAHSSELVANENMGISFCFSLSNKSLGSSGTHETISCVDQDILLKSSIEYTSERDMDEGRMCSWVKCR